MPTKTGNAKTGHYQGTDAIEHVQRMMAASPRFAGRVREEMERLEISTKIKVLRRRRRLTQGALAARAGTRQPNIARIEQGSAMPKIELLTKITHALGCRLDVRFVAERWSA